MQIRIFDKKVEKVKKSDDLKKEVMNNPNNANEFSEKN
jgi:hypothetical protein